MQRIVFLHSANINLLIKCLSLQVDFKFNEKSYSNLLSNSTLASLFEVNATSIGVKFETNEEKIQKFGGSTDMGNVTHIVPGIHPKFYIGSFIVETKQTIF